MSAMAISSFVKMHYRRWCFLSLSGMMLSGCLLATTLEAVDRSVKYTRERIEAMANLGQTEPEREPRITGYCYSTLGEVDCYDYPQEGQEFRLVGMVPIPERYKMAEQSVKAAAVNTLEENETSLEDEAAESLRSELELLAERRRTGRRLAGTVTPSDKPTEIEMKLLREPVDLLEFDIDGKSFQLKDLGDRKEEVTF